MENEELSPNAMRRLLVGAGNYLLHDKEICGDRAEYAASYLGYLFDRTDMLEAQSLPDGETAILVPVGKVMHEGMVNLHWRYGNPALPASERPSSDFMTAVFAEEAAEMVCLYATQAYKDQYGPLGRQ